MQNNMQRLGDTLSKNMVRSAKSSIPTTVELGIINSDLSLTVDGLSGRISKNDYMVDLRLTHENYYSYNELNSSAKKPHHHEGGTHTQEVGSGYHTHDDGLHDHRAPSVFRRLEAGDRVLVIWVGYEPIIVAIVVAGTTITEND